MLPSVGDDRLLLQFVDIIQLDKDDVMFSVPLSYFFPESFPSDLRKLTFVMIQTIQTVDSLFFSQRGFPFMNCSIIINECSG